MHFSHINLDIISHLFDFLSIMPTRIEDVDWRFHVPNILTYLIPIRFIFHGLSFFLWRSSLTVIYSYIGHDQYHTQIRAYFHNLLNELTTQMETKTHKKRLIREWIFNLQSQGTPTFSKSNDFDIINIKHLFKTNKTPRVRTSNEPSFT